MGEGGGQVLRSALALALITGTSFTITNIRTRRPKPGLMAQHLKAVEAASAVGMAHVEGAQLGSQFLAFEPTTVVPGDFHFQIGTAGSTSLVLQTLLCPLSFARAGSSITIIGGTHVPWSPSFHFLALHWLPYLRRIGFDIQLELQTAGFYPQGGGRVRATVNPIKVLAPLQLIKRGELKRIRGISAVANLDTSIADRQRAQTLKRISSVSDDVEIEIRRFSSPSRGTFLLLLAEFEHSQCCFCGLGARGKRAERVADEAVDELMDFLATDGVVDHYLADQLVLPLALAAGVSQLRTSRVTQHLVTNVEIVQMFLHVTIEIDQEIGRPGMVRIKTR
jgi:RNA 3'-terminal phosphate cyclase (ATP)